MTLKYSWQKLYEDAVLETSNEKLPEMLRLAEEVVHARLQEIRDVDGRARFERQALEDASVALRTLRRLPATRA